MPETMSAGEFVNGRESKMREDIAALGEYIEGAKKTLAICLASLKNNPNQLTTLMQSEHLKKRVDEWERTLTEMKGELNGFRPAARV